RARADASRLPERQPIDRGEERSERLARPGWCNKEGGITRCDRRPPKRLHARRSAERAAKPCPRRWMKALERFTSVVHEPLPLLLPRRMPRIGSDEQVATDSKIARGNVEVLRRSTN